MKLVLTLGKTMIPNFTIEIDHEKLADAVNWCLIELETGKFLIQLGQSNTFSFDDVKDAKRFKQMFGEKAERR